MKNPPYYMKTNSHSTEIWEHGDIELSNDYTSYASIYRINKKYTIKKWLIWIFLAMLVILFLPWTQNIQTKGTVTTLLPAERPQQVNALIAGKIAKWYIKEGDHVEAGDTILQLAEVKVEYFDPGLLNRTQQQISAKKQSLENYQNKAATAATQAKILSESRELKLNQLEIKMQQQALKVQTDSIDIVALENELNIAERQFDAAKQMLDSGVVPLVEMERKKISYQNARAKITGAQNKLLQSKQELINLQLEIRSATQDYADKIAKAQGERFAALSDAATAEGEMAKLNNMYANYDARNKLYFITAPQSGQIVQAKKAGLGEFVKDGEMIAEIVPDNFHYAVNLAVEPVDQPLLSKGQQVRFVFDGFPAILFSGWPSASYGVFNGVVVAVQNNADANGKFHVLVKEDTAYKPWPQQLRVGTGATGIALLKNVPIWYELWRNINGFPPEYYKPQNEKTTQNK
jgi:multidrug efflux pump subunit AcrA (membrane-fusion protein)